MFSSRASSTVVFIHLPFPAQSQLSTLFAFSQSNERKKRTGGRQDIRRNTFELSARKRAGILYEMYNLAGCTVVSRNLRSRKPTAFRYSAPHRSKFYPPSVIRVPCPRSVLLVGRRAAHMRRTRRHVSFGDAAT